MLYEIKNNVLVVESENMISYKELLIWVMILDMLLSLKLITQNCICVPNFMANLQSYLYFICCTVYKLHQHHTSLIFVKFSGIRFIC